MKKALILFIIICLVNANKLFAYNGAIVGIAVDAKTNIAIENAMVGIINQKNIFFTNENGKVILTDIPENEYQLEISKLGYVSQIVSVKVIDFEKTNIVIKLVGKQIALQEIKISSSLAQNKNVMQKINIARIPINSAQDILKSVPGLFIAQHAGGGKAEQIFLRGFDCDHGTDIALAVDGMPVNMVSHAHGQGYADLHFVIPETVEKLQVNKGTYQASVGNFSTAGNIQFTTKKYLDKNSISLEKGIYNSNRIVLMTNLLSNKIEKNSNWILAIEYNFNKGYFVSPMNLHRFNLFTKYNQRINERNRWSVQATYFNSHWNASGQIPERLVDANTISKFGSVDASEGGNTSRFNISTSLITELKNQAIIKQQLFYNRYSFNLFSNFTFYKKDTANGDMIRQKEDRDIIGYNGSYEKSTEIFGYRTHTTIGIQSRIDVIHNSELSNVKQRYTFLKPISLGNIKELNTAIYADGNIEISKKLQINLGLRYDAFYYNYFNKLANAQQDKSLVKGTLGPKASITYTFNHKIQGFAMVGKSFHSNDARVVVAQQGKQSLPTALGSEMGSIIKPFSKLYLNVSLWQLHLQQEFIYVGDEAVVEAGGATVRRGIDIGVKYQLHKNLFADADINYALGKMIDAPNSENKIPLAPNFTSIGGLTYNTIKGIQASLRYRHLGNRAANESNSIVAIGYTLLDAVASFQYKKITLGISAENILNTSWKEAQFETETQLKTETQPVSEIHFTAGTPFVAKFKIGYQF